MYGIPRPADTSPMDRIPTAIARLSRLMIVTVLATLLPLAFASPAMAARQKSIRINDASVVEGDSGQKNMTFTISWTGSKGGAAPTVHYATADASATAGADYTTTTGTASLTNGGCRCATVNVPILGDTMTEGTETFTVNLSSPANGTIADAQGVGTIYDNEGPPSFVVTDATGAEASGSLSFSVMLTNANGSSVSVDYATADGMALAGSDYTAKSGTLTFTPGQTSKSVAVTILNDALAEDDETFSLNLSNSTGGIAIADAVGLGTIQNDDADPTVSVASASVAEGDTGTTTLSFPVTLSGPSGREVDVDYATSDGTASAGSDYTATSGTLIFNPGETSHQIDVTVSGDFLDEGDETITVTLTSPFNADLGTDVATGTITNDDAGPKLYVADATVTEGNSGTTPLVFTVTMAPVSLLDVSVDWATADGTATAGSDYVAGSGTLTIPAGQASGSITVNVNGDTTVEPNETLTLSLSSPVGAKIVPPITTSGTIVNDDRVATALTLKVAKTTKLVTAKGTIQAAVTGMKVKVSLLKKVGSRFRLLASKKVGVKSLLDRNGDGILDGGYLASFARPARGAYKICVKYAGSTTYAPSSTSATFKA
jgi:Calx-beta domain-containing protein